MSNFEVLKSRKNQVTNSRIFTIRIHFLYQFLNPMLKCRDESQTEFLAPAKCKTSFKQSDKKENFSQAAVLLCFLLFSAARQRHDERNKV